MRARYCVLVFAAARLASAANVEVSSNTLVGSRPVQLRDEVRMAQPLIETVGLRVSGIENPYVEDLRLAVSAWGELDALTRDSLGGDVDVAYVEGRLFKRRLQVRLGRQLMVGGVTRAAYVDGVRFDYRSQLGVGLGTFAGIPVARHFANTLRGDWIAGARAFFAPRPTMEVGVSFLHAAERGALARQDVGADARWLLLGNLNLLGRATFSLAEQRLAELDLGPTWQPLERLEVSAGYRRLAPDLFLSRTSILSVFAESSRDDVGASAFYRLSDRMGVFGEYRFVRQDLGQGTDAGLRFTYRTRRTLGSTLTAQARLLRMSHNGFVQGRVGVGHQLGKGLGLTVDLDGYYLDKPVNAQRVSLAATGALTMALGPQWNAAVAVSASSTPHYESRVEGMAKITYVFEHQGSKP